MNILAEVKSFSLYGSLIQFCSLNKTQRRILILITRIKMVCKLTWTQDCFQVRKFVSTFVRLFGCVSWLSSQAFDEKRENWWQVLSLRSFAKQILAICSAVRGFHHCSKLTKMVHVNKDIWKPSIGDSLTCKREFDNCLDKFAIKVVNKGEIAGHLPRKFLKIAWYHFDFILCALGVIHGKLQIFFQMFSQISRTPDFKRSFRVKRCGLYAGVYGSFLVCLFFGWACTAQLTQCQQVHCLALLFYLFLFFVSLFYFDTLLYDIIVGMQCVQF